MIDLKTGGTEVANPKPPAPGSLKPSANPINPSTVKSTADQNPNNKNADKKDSTDQVAPCSPVWRCVRMICVGILGIATIVVGLILVPLPGPGWLIVFGGFGILGTEFPWARNLCRAVKIKVKKGWNWMFRKRTKPA